MRSIPAKLRIADRDRAIGICSEKDEHSYEEADERDEHPDILADEEHRQHADERNESAADIEKVLVHQASGFSSRAVICPFL